MRYRVTEIEGWLTPERSHTRKGVSCHVIDTASNHRVVATFRSEDYRTRGFVMLDSHGRARRDAHAEAERLNAMFT